METLSGRGVSMRFMEPLFLGDSIHHPAREWKKKNAYLICLSLNPDEQLDLFPSRVVQQKHFPQKALSVVGVAADYTEALEVVRRMTERIYSETGDCDYRRYFNSVQEGAAS